MQELEYQKSDCALTLRKAYDEYLAANAFKGFFKPSSLEEPLRTFFQNHDLVHVIFGLNTDLKHEVLADLWTFFGVDISVKAYLSYVRYPKVKETIKGVPFIEGLKTLLLIPKAMALFLKSRRLKKKWTWQPDPARWQQPLNEIRREFGVELIQ